MNAVRTLVASTGFVADANVQPRHPADASAWVWHPDRPWGTTAFLSFSLELNVETDETIRVHVTADQCFQFRVDGVDVGYGPDRGDVEKWMVATYTLLLKAGTHRLEALVWWLNDETLTGLRVDPAQATESARGQVRPPVAQTTWRGGFLFAGEGEWAKRLNTGMAPWQVADLTAAVTLVQPTFYAYHDIGPEFHIAGETWTAPSRVVPAEVVVGGIPGNAHGVQRPGWRLEPTRLPEQAITPVRSGRVRALVVGWTEGSFDEAQVNANEAAEWTAALRDGREVTIPPHTERTLVWDFEAYVCGYALLSTCGGRGARVRIDWAEALHECAAREFVTRQTAKGHRDMVEGKLFYGFGDEFFPSEGRVDFPAWWWRSGRYLRVQVSTSEAPLTIRSLQIRATGYPLGAAAEFITSDAGINRLVRRCENTIRACAHEVWADCPYYEQMAYVGDSRLSALNNYVMFADDRLSRRMLELFDDSRRVNGLVAERAPATWHQVSVTYSLLWVLMVRDFAWWRDDRYVVTTHLRGVRAMLEEINALADSAGLLRAVPGWPFVDWVPDWHEGCGPGVREGDSSIVNLHWLLALRAHAELETVFGEPELAALASRRAEALARAIVARYWNTERGLLADTGRHADYSEHAQALGILSGITPAGGVNRWTDTWLAAKDLTAATMYFSFYVMDAWRAMGCEDALHRRLGALREVEATGLLTLPEAPEPTRSDCHAWTAQVRWHLAASVAGVRPAAPGFARVEVAPLLGELEKIDTVVRHPRGDIVVSLRRAATHLSGLIELPEGIEGELKWADRRYPLRSGKNKIDAC
jgi:alpha-L-rhamnosidase